MANYANLLATIAANIYTNNNNEVTAAMVKTAVDQMVASLGAGYQFMAVATPATNPGTPDQRVFYIASMPGTYTNFGGLVVNDGELAILKWNGSWSKDSTGIESSIWKASGLINVDAIVPKVGYYNEGDAIAAVPSGYRKLGAIITYKLNDKLSALEQFIGTSLAQWNNTAFWVRLNKSVTDLYFTEGFMEISLNSYDSGTGIATFDIKVRHKCVAYKTTHTSYLSELDPLEIPVGTYSVSCPTGYGVTKGLWWNTNGAGAFEAGTSPTDFQNCFLVFPILTVSATTMTPKAAPRGDIALRYDSGGNWIWMEPRPLSVMSTLEMSKVIPTDSNDYEFKWLVLYMFKAYYELKFPEGEFSCDYFPAYSNVGKRKISGQGIDKTIFKSASGVTTCAFASHNNVDLQDMTLKNIMLKDGVRNEDIKKNKGDTFTRVKFYYDISAPSSGYAIAEMCDTYKLVLRDCVFLVENGLSFPVGCSIEGSTHVDIQGCSFSGFSQFCILVAQASGGIVKNCKCYGSTSAIHFRSSKNNVSQDIVVEDCYIEEPEEEGISFDSYGNNVSLCPFIAELAVNDAEQIIDSISAYIFSFKMKLYCDARNVVGTHPNESFAAYSFTGNEDYLKQFYLVFHKNAGADYAGIVAKILDVGHDSVKGDYVIVGLDRPFDNFEGMNDYKAVSILSGFFYLTIRNNVIRNGKQTGLAIYGTCFNATIEGNTIENCKGVGTYPKTAYEELNPVYKGGGSSYVMSYIALSVGVYFPCYNIAIVNNRFIGGLYFPFALSASLGLECLGYGCVMSGNTIIGGLGLMLTGQRNFAYGDNVVCGKDAKLYITGCESNKFGRSLPAEPMMGDEFLLMQQDLDAYNNPKQDIPAGFKRFNGTSWDTIY